MALKHYVDKSNLELLMLQVCEPPHLNDLLLAFMTVALVLNLPSGTAEEGQVR